MEESARKPISKDKDIKGPSQAGSLHEGRPDLGTELEDVINRNSVVGSHSPDQGNPLVDTKMEHRTPPVGPFPIPENHRP